MQAPLLYDAVTLRHFAAVGKLDVCERTYGALTGPRVCRTVYDEITRHATAGSVECVALLSCGWLGHPIAPSAEDLKQVFRLLTALHGGVHVHGTDTGEAESICLAEKHGGSFATDDNAAYDFAARRLGPNRVTDSVGILRAAVAIDAITAADAVAVVREIRTAGRFLRRVHPAAFTEADLL
jgi:predicted nucleic acid-binding protein